jgi:hypothetical protein
MARSARGRRKGFRRGRGDAAGFEHTSKRDLTEVVGDHLIPEEQRDATAGWHPQRRGSSPHHRG